MCSVSMCLCFLSDVETHDTCDTVELEDSDAKVKDQYEAHPWHYDMGEAYYKDTNRKRELAEFAKEMGPKNGMVSYILHMLITAS